MLSQQITSANCELLYMLSAIIGSILYIQICLCIFENKVICGQHIIVKDAQQVLTVSLLFTRFDLMVC